MQPKKKKKKEYSDDDGSDGGSYGNHKVYDSDGESDDESMFVSTRERKEVVEFLNTATNGELMAVKSLSARKIEFLLPLRPFDDWMDLLQKINKNRLLSTEILNFCQEYLNQRSNMDRIMKKCKKLVNKLGEAVARGDKVVKQPDLLNHDLKLADYQLVGLNWMTIIHSQNMNGILADEMGLGKVNQNLNNLNIIFLIQFSFHSADHSSDCIFSVSERDQSVSWDAFNHRTIIDA